MPYTIETSGDSLPSSTPRHKGSAPLTLSGKAVVASWVVSIIVHVVLFSGMLALVFPFSGAPDETDPAVTHVELVGPLEASSFTISNDLNLTEPRSAPDPLDIKPPPKPVDILSDLTPNTKPDLPIIGIGAGGGDFADYGLTIGGASGPEFFGLGASAKGARSVVYVVDRSGSMMDSFAYVQAELRRSISSLRRSQKFHVIFFNSGAPLENPPKRPVPAIGAYKERFFEFLSTITPGGGTRPESAMKRALAMKPDLVYLLSDGVDFHSTLIEKLDIWNADRRVRIYTIAYLDRHGSELLEIVAREHRGEFTFVSDDDLP